MKYIDILAKDLASLNLTELRNKYREKILSGTTIKKVADSLEKQGLLTALIRTDWRNDGKDPNGLYLIRDNHRYQVFIGERGIKLQLEEFPNLKSASQAWIDLTFNELYYSAPDTEIK